MKLVITVFVAALLTFGLSVSGAAASSYYSGFSSYSYPSYTSNYTYRPPIGYGLSSYYGQLNRAGFPKTQYVSPYYRSNGTYVSGYWRNSPSDGLHTCLIVRC